MLKAGFIGYGAIAQFVTQKLTDINAPLALVIARSGRFDGARAGGTRLRLSTGAIGGLDSIASARFSALETVTYIGRKPLRGWKGSRAEEVVNLDELSDQAVTHFKGSARDAVSEKRQCCSGRCTGGDRF